MKNYLNIFVIMKENIYKSVKIYICNFKNKNNYKIS